MAEVDRLVRSAADQANARVTLLGVNRGSFGTQPFVKSDSNANADIRDLEFPAVEAAIQSGRPERATESGRDGRVVELALPLFFRDAAGHRLLGSVAVYSAPLEDVQANVDLVRTRILIAGLLALAAAVLAGFLVAQSLGRRVGRLEQVARRVSTGDFSARFPVDRDDELGRLAAALDAMQRQLAELDTARRRFIATASHELRTPIFSLGGFLELLEDEDLDEETRTRFMDQLHQQVDRLGKLTTDLLDLSRLDAGAHRAAHRRDRHRPTSPRRSPPSSCPALGAHESELELQLGDDPIVASLRPRARRAGAADPARQRARPHARSGTDLQLSAGREDGRVRLAVTRRRARDPARRPAPGLRAVLHLGRRAAAPASASRSRASSRSAWAGS